MYYKSNNNNNNKYLSISMIYLRKFPRNDVTHYSIGCFVSSREMTSHIIQSDASFNKSIIQKIAVV